MSEQSGTCFTLEAALEKAIDLETNIFKQFIKAIRTTSQDGAKEVLREAAIEELRHKQHLERALLEGGLDNCEINKVVPTMNLDHRFGVVSIDRDADSRAALAHAIHLINTSVQFYQMMIEACEGAPMAAVFRQIGTEQKQHLQKLEDSFEEHFLTEN